MALRNPGAGPTVSVPAAAAGGAPSTPASAPNGAPSTPPPASTTPPAQARDLAAMRARLAGGQNGGVNSPEGATKIVESLVAPRTQETPDGRAEPISADTTAAPIATPSASPEVTAKRKRRTQAEMAAARAAKKAASTPQTTPEAGPPAPAAASEASAGAGFDPTFPDNRYLERIATALEEIAKTLRERLPL